MKMTKEYKEQMKKMVGNMKYDGAYTMTDTDERLDVFKLVTPTGDIVELHYVEGRIHQVGINVDEFEKEREEMDCDEFDKKYPNAEFMENAYVKNYKYETKREKKDREIRENLFKKHSKSVSDILDDDEEDLDLDI